MKIASRYIATLLCTWLLLGMQSALAYEVRDIRIEGLQNVEPGVVFRNFPVKEGDEVSDRRLSKALRTLFESGYFDDLELLKDGDVLVISVVERPTIAVIRLEGNSEVDEEQLLEGIALHGVKEGEVFRQSALDQIRNDLVSVYSSLGRYGADVDTDVEELPGNRVALNVTLNEGKESSIQHINIVGNSVYDDETLTDLFESSLPGFFSWFTEDDHYAREKLAGDLERLRSYYLNHGYINFQVDSTQVSISPDKANVFITINVSEGAQFTVRDYNLSGDFVVEKSELEPQVITQVGDVFSREEVVKSQDAIEERLGDDGYLFAKVQPVPEVHDDNTVSITYFLNPGKRTYVRRISIKGNTKTSDDVIRREMRQMEAAPASSAQIAASKQRLERTGFFSQIEVETTPVPGTDDQVDIQYTVGETQSGTFSASAGFSGDDGLLLGLSVEQDNFLGSGDKVGFSISTSDSTKTYELTSTDPYYTIDGVSRGYKLYYREQDFDEDDVSSYEIDEIGAGINFGYPIDENQRLNFGFTGEAIKVKTNDYTPQEVLDYIDDEGNDYFNTVVDISWSDSTLNRGVFPTRGYRQNASLELGLPVGDLAYYRSSYTLRYFQPLTESERWVGKAWTRLGYGDSLGDNEFPFFKHYFAGGIRSVRGFSANSLGPQDTPTSTDYDSDPFGGNVLMTGGIELITPTPFVENSTTLRNSLFLDVGNVFDTSCGQTSTNCEEGIQLEELRVSTGLAINWMTPVGPLNFVLGFPLNEKAGDSTETFQFSIGQTF